MDMKLKSRLGSKTVGGSLCPNGEFKFISRDTSHIGISPGTKPEKYVFDL